ncbi:uncharacterized protein LOC120419975 isoform X3 [Culex pipiens pallens]|uniref:uncharacterized protein LOC120419975 isoform X3 n=1 Tax=Culex pipiens pallens TaxID=42434 RepID=UPI0022AB351C|nr:uncharacterized protein LOC120419975 isoform X3 [Culex pipiens pallens]
MEPTPPKRVKMENVSAEDVPEVSGEPSEHFSDNVEYEMLIDEYLEGFDGESEEEDSDSSLSSSGSSNSEDGPRIKAEKSASLEYVKPTDGSLEAGPDSNEAIAQLGESGEQDVTSPGCWYHHSDSGKEFINVQEPIPTKVAQLNCSARLVDGDFDIWLHDVGSLMLVGEGFIARVAPIDVNELRQATSFAQAKTVLLSQLRIVRIVLDDATTERESQRKDLHDLFAKIRQDRSSAADAAQILRIAESSNALTYRELCEQLLETPLTSAKLREQAAKLLRIERETERRNEFLQRFSPGFCDDTRELNIALERFCEVVVLNKVNALLDAPQFLRDLLDDVPMRTIYRVHEDDVAAFREMEKVLDVAIFRKPLTDLAKRWIERMKSQETSDPLVNPMYVSLCRSLDELIAAIIARSDHSPEELLRSDQHGWHPLETAIKWRSDTVLAGCLEREYNFLFRLLSQNERPFEGTIADEHRVWFCLLEEVLRDLDLGPFEQIVASYLQLLKKSNISQVEKIRVVTHSVGRFVVQTCPLASSVDSDEDKQILHSQLGVINRAMLSFAEPLPDLLEVVTCYWKNRCKIVEKFPRKKSGAEMEQIKKTLLKIVAVALRKQVDVPTMIALLRAVNAFVVDLDGVTFEWLVKSLPEKPKNAALALEYIEPVDSKWSGTSHQAYRVTEADKFHQLFAVLLDGATCPRNYAVDVVNELLACVQSQLEQRGWSEQDQIVSVGALLTAIGASLVHLRRQAEYESYEQFLEDSVRPFCAVVERSQSMDEFCKRIRGIEESFRDEISLWLKTFGELNDADSFSAEEMKRTYLQYGDHFEKYATESGQALASSLQASVHPTHFKVWTHQFKQTELPKILAGVAAVWTKASYNRPHCSQIMAVLRLLGADKYKQGIPKHLAQIPAGGGKPLVLALIAAVLALTGHRILLIYRSKYLAKRDANKFARLLKLLGVIEAVKYGTYDDMVDAVIAPRVDGEPLELQTLVSDLILAPPDKQRPAKLNAQHPPVLLVDEVDVFFDKEVYGKEYCPGAFPVVPGLEQIQEKIWKLVTDRDLRDVQEVMTRIEKLISSPRFTRKQEFDTFLNNKTPFDLIVTLSSANHVRKQFTNRNLFYSELQSMVENAISVATDRAQHADFKLNQQGAITYRDGDRFVTWSIPGYKSVFNYFRLKHHNFELRVGSTKNYGYLNVGCGLFAYALLPTAFPLILAVTASPLATLNHHERETLNRFYAIHHSSTLPNSRTQFNPAADFTHRPTKPLWMEQILSRAKAQPVNRPVIIFFRTSTLLEEFRALHAHHLDHVQVLTEQSAKDQIEQVGTAGRITLATRGMARGVNYGEDLHVIRTFFSVEDQREEARIGGCYELIVCDEHLKEDGLVGADFGGTYAELEEARAVVWSRESEPNSSGTGAVIVNSQSITKTPMSNLTTRVASITISTDQTLANGVPATGQPSVVTTQQPQQSATQSVVVTTTTGGQTAQKRNLIDNTKEKCRKFLTNLIELAKRHPKLVEKNVLMLIQELVDANVEPETFCERLVRLLNVSPKPCLVGFLKQGLPLLRQSLVTKEITIEGINPPPANVTFSGSPLAQFRPVTKILVSQAAPRLHGPTPIRVLMTQSGMSTVNRIGQTTIRPATLVRLQTPLQQQQQRAYLTTTMMGGPWQIAAQQIRLNAGTTVGQTAIGQTMSKMPQALLPNQPAKSSDAPANNARDDSDVSKGVSKGGPSQGDDPVQKKRLRLSKLSVIVEEENGAKLKKVVPAKHRQVLPALKPQHVLPSPVEVTGDGTAIKAIADNPRKRSSSSNVPTEEQQYPKRFKCVQCPKTYSNKGGLSLHVKEIHLGRKEPFTCTICGKVLFGKAVFKQHLNVHIRPFQCEICKKTFSQYRGKQVHLCAGKFKPQQ